MEEKRLILLQVLNDAGMKFIIEGCDTVYIQFPENMNAQTMMKVITAIMESEPDEFGEDTREDTKKFYRLWWD